MAERLTDDERSKLATAPDCTGEALVAKALRSIDALQARAEAAERNLNAAVERASDIGRECAALRAQLKDGDDADAAMRDLCAALRAEVELQRAAGVEHMREVERLRGILDVREQIVAAATDARVAAESRLAARDRVVGELAERSRKLQPLHGRRDIRLPRRPARGAGG